jgi:hypothetical protein
VVALGERAYCPYTHPEHTSNSSAQFDATQLRHPLDDESPRHWNAQFDAAHAPTEP